MTPFYLNSFFRNFVEDWFGSDLFYLTSRPLWGRNSSSTIPPTPVLPVWDQDPEWFRCPPGFLPLLPGLGGELRKKVSVGRKITCWPRTVGQSVKTGNVSVRPGLPTLLLPEYKKLEDDTRWVKVLFIYSLPVDSLVLHLESPFPLVCFRVPQSTVTGLQGKLSLKGIENFTKNE